MKRLALAIMTVSITLAQSQTTPPAMNLYFLSWEDGASGIYLYNTETGVDTRIHTNNGKGMALSPDGKQIALCTYGNGMRIMNNDGSNPRDIPDVYMNTDNSYYFAWTEQGIFWVHHNRETLIDSFYSYVPETGLLRRYPPFHAKEGSSSFGGCFASRDGTRMFTWITEDIPCEYTGSDRSKPYIFFKNGDFDTPIVDHELFWGHGNMMLPGGRYSLGVWWAMPPGEERGDHRWMRTWDWDNMEEGPTYRFPLDGGKYLAPIINSDDWILVQIGGENRDTNCVYFWKFATDTAWTSYGERLGQRIYCGWQGSLPSPVSWAISEQAFTLTDSTWSDTFHITGWTDASNPVVSTDKSWTGTPAIAMNGSTGTIAFTVSTPPSEADTAVVTVEDGNGANQLVRIYYQPTQTVAERLEISKDVTTESVTLSWTGTVEGYSYEVSRLDGSSWSVPMLVTDSSYVDSDPVNGTNTYRVYAVSGSDTSYQQVTADYTAPPALTITSPGNGETCAPGTQITLIWDAVNVSSIEVEMSTDEGDTWTLLSDSGAIDYGEDLWANYPLTLPATDGNVLIQIHPYQETVPSDMVLLTVSSSSVVTPPAAARPTGASRSAAIRYDLRGRIVTGRGNRPPTGLLLISRDAQEPGRIRIHVR
jgi:hypothetical protein